MLEQFWVIDASPIITLARVGLGHVFQQLARSIMIPHAVAQEILAGSVDDPARLLIEQHYFPVVAPFQISNEVVQWNLGAGETAVLEFALANLGWTAILDDGAARRCAKAINIPVKGTLGIVLLAKQHYLIDSARFVFEAMSQQGFRIDQSLVDSILYVVDEA